MSVMANGTEKTKGQRLEQNKTKKSSHKSVKSKSQLSSRYIRSGSQSQFIIIF